MVKLVKNKKIVISNKLGLHARAAAKFVRIAAGYQSEIMINSGNQEVSGKSIMGIMMSVVYKTEGVRRNSIPHYPRRGHRPRMPGRAGRKSAPPSYSSGTFRQMIRRPNPIRYSPPTLP